jgi:hypothetical protein
MHPDRRRRHGGVGTGFEVRLLAAVDEQPVALVAHQPQQGTLELIEAWNSASVGTHMGGAVVEPVERIVDLLVDTASRPRESTHVDDG